MLTNDVVSFEQLGPGQYIAQCHAKRLSFPVLLFEKVVKWNDKLPDTEVLRKAGMQYMHTVLKLTQTMLNEWLMSGFHIYIWRITNGKALLWRPEKRYKDTLKASMKDFSIPRTCLRTGCILENGLHVFCIEVFGMCASGR